MLGYAFLLRLNNVNAANQIPGAAAYGRTGLPCNTILTRTNHSVGTGRGYARALSLGPCSSLPRSILLSSCPVICEEYTP